MPRSTLFQEGIADDSCGEGGLVCLVEVESVVELSDFVVGEDGPEVILREEV